MLMDYGNIFKVLIHSLKLISFRFPLISLSTRRRVNRVKNFVMKSKLYSCVLRAFWKYASTPDQDQISYHKEITTAWCLSLNIGTNMF